MDVGQEAYSHAGTENRKEGLMSTFSDSLPRLYSNTVHPSPLAPTPSVLIKDPTVPLVIDRDSSGRTGWYIARLGAGVRDRWVWDTTGSRCITTSETRNASKGQPRDPRLNSSSIPELRVKQMDSGELLPLLLLPPFFIGRLKNS
jgi:hypothetical protein